MSGKRPTKPLSDNRRDLLWVLLAVVATFIFAASVELFERVEQLVERFERMQLDEALFALISLALGLAWYALRRRRDAMQALTLAQHSEAQVAELLALNRELSQRLMSSQEQERLELARDLHDDIGQFCNAIRVEAECIVVDGAGSHQVGARRIADMADDLYGRVHALLRRLRPADLDELGIVAALQSLCEAWEITGATACVLHPVGQFDGIGNDIETAVYRVAQEALSNVMRHAKAQTVRIALQRGPDGAVLLEVRDDGIGFDTTQARRGLGLLGADERARALGGRCLVTSRPGSGTLVQLHLPTPAEETAPCSTRPSR
jgi:signal transduction histidine kinase